MSNLETLLTAWLNDGEVPAGFEPETRIEEYLVAILEGVDDSVTPESRADVLLDAIAAKYAGFANGVNAIRDALGFTGHPIFDDAKTPSEIAQAQAAVNGEAVTEAANKGVTITSDNTLGILTELFENWPSGGASLNIGYGNTAPEDTSKLWVKTAQPQNITADYDINNGVESVQATAAVFPSVIAGAACGVVGTKVYLFGGNRGSGATNTINIFDASTKTITTSTTTLPASSVFSACGVVGSMCYLFGGENSGGYLNTVVEYDTINNTATTLTAMLPTAVTQTACGVVGDKIYIFGGVGAGEVTQNTISVFDTVNNTITTLSTTLPETLGSAACGVVGDKIYIFGGWHKNGYYYEQRNKIRVFDTLTETVTTLPATLPQAYSSIACGVVGTKVYLFGGYSGVFYNTIVAFDAETETVTTLSETLPVALANTSCGVVGTKVYLFGGSVSGGQIASINEFTVTFPLAEGDVFIQEDLFKNKFTLLPAPIEVKTGVSAVYVGNASNYAETAEAYLYDEDTSAWAPLT